MTRVRKLVRSIPVNVASAPDMDAFVNRELVPLLAELRRAVNAIQKGTATLVAGQVTVSVTYGSGAVILWARRDLVGPAGTTIYCPEADRTGTSFKLVSSDPLDNSTVDWAIL